MAYLQNNCAMALSPKWTKQLPTILLEIGRNFSELLQSFQLHDNIIPIFLGEKKEKKCTMQYYRIGRFMKKVITVKANRTIMSERKLFACEGWSLKGLLPWKTMGRPKNHFARFLTNWFLFLNCTGHVWYVSKDIVE